MVVSGGVVGAGVVASGAGASGAGVGVGVSVVCALAPAAPKRVSPTTSAPERTRSLIIFSPPNVLSVVADLSLVCHGESRTHQKKSTGGLATEREVLAMLLPYRGKRFA